MPNCCAGSQIVYAGTRRSDVDTMNFEVMQDLSLAVMHSNLRPCFSFHVRIPKMKNSLRFNQNL